MSMQRDPTTAKETDTLLPMAKARAARIPTDYYKKRNPLERWKILLSLGATIVTVVWIVYGIAADSGAPAPSFVRGRNSHGPVCQAHAEHANDCSKCHVSFAPFASDAVDKANQKCQTCHMEVDPAKGINHEQHWSYQLKSSTPSCGACHSDHRGRDVDLKLVADSYCIGCHGDVPNHVEGAYKDKLRFAKKIESFPTDHPEFAPLKKKDPGTIRFSHAFHLKPDLIGSLDDIEDTKVRDRYAKFQTAKGFQLDCTACHELGELPGLNAPLPAERFRDADGRVLPIQKPGAYYKPVNFVADCLACHPMPKPPGFKDRLPHGFISVKQNERIVLEPPEMRKYITERLTKIIRDNPQAFQADIPKPLRPLPGKLEEAVQPSQFDPDKARVEAEKRTFSALFGGGGACAKCHYDPNGKPLNDKTDQVARIDNRVNGPTIPPFWLRHAQFNHRAHEFITDCKKCHPQARGGSLELGVPEVTNDATRDGAATVMLPNVQSCRQCHGPTEVQKVDAMFKVERRPAGFGCTECHSYHHGTARK